MKPLRDRDAIDEHFAARQRMWHGGWRRYLFPGLWLVYMAQTVHGVFVHSHGAAIVVGCVLVAVFCVCYLLAFPSAWTRKMRSFWILYTVAYLLTVALTFFAHGDAFVCCVYLAVLTIAGIDKYSLVIVGVMAAIIMFVPLLVGWQHGPDYESGLTVVLVSFAMYGFFSIIRSNIELAQARAEIARLAAEGERTRIARDLHDLLGHSLTTITVKAGLARRLAERGELDRAQAEITSVEELSRRSLADVRAAVSGYREVTLGGELATAREVLRAAGILAQLPAATEVVDAQCDELFGWVVREGVTNVVRHSHAVRCTITAGPNWVDIVDDGVGGVGAAGNGLTGLRERVAELAGAVEAGGCAQGWRLRVDVPTVSVPPGTAPAQSSGAIAP